MLRAFAENYIELGDLDKARDRAQECADIARSLRQQREGGVAASRALAGCLAKIANALSTRSLFNDSIRAYQESVELQRALLAADPGNTELQADLGQTLTYYSFVVLNAGRTDDAYALARESLAISASLAKRDRSNARWMREYIDSLNICGMVLDEKGETSAAIEVYAEAVRIGGALVDEDRGLANYSDVLLKDSKNDQALAALDRSIALKRRLHAADAENATWEYELSAALIKLGMSRFVADRIDDSLTSLDEARQRFKSLVQRDAGNSLHRWWLARCLWMMANINLKKGDAATAQANAQEGLATLQAVDLDRIPEEVGAWMRDLRDKLVELQAPASPQ
jgi:tetratricopeptide (TPR) repeat protein